MQLSIVSPELPTVTFKLEVIFIWVLFIMLYFNANVLADCTIWLKNGSRIESSFCKEEGNEVKFQKFGGFVGLNKGQINKVEGTLYSQQMLKKRKEKETEISDEKERELSSTTKYRVSCKDILLNVENRGDGLYIIDADGSGPGKPFEVYCDMTTDGGGWTLFTVINQLLPDRGSGKSDWALFISDQLGWNDLNTTKLSKKPAVTIERIKVVGTGWHIDMKSAEATDSWRLDPCVEDTDHRSSIMISQENVEGTPDYLEVRNNKGNGCTGIGHVYMKHSGDNIHPPAKKIAIKGVTPPSDGAFYYLLTFSAYSPQWPPPPRSNLGGWRTQCDPISNDKHYRCSGFVADPNWTGVYMYYR